jgi:tetratricopeptide (TPR) repeat protein
MLAWQVHENYRDAEQHYRSALEVFRRRGSPIRAAQALGSLAEIAYATGDLRFAIDLAEQSLRIFEEIGNTSYVADRLTLLAKYRVALNEDELALPLLRDALTAFSDLDQPLEIAECAFVAAEILARRGDFVTAANLYGFAQHVRDSGRPTARADRERAERLQGSLISKLDETQYASLVRTGTLLAHTQAAIMALAAIDEAA